MNPNNEISLINQHLNKTGMNLQICLRPGLISMACTKQVWLKSHPMRGLAMKSRIVQSIVCMLLMGLALWPLANPCAAEAPLTVLVVQPTNDVNYQEASGWWTDLPNIWTPVAWKDNLFRGSVFWNGMILAQPDLNRRTEAWAGQGLQLTVLPTFDGTEGWSSGFLRVDNDMVRQGWNHDAAPVLWSEWTEGGLLMREEVFAHIAGGGDVITGDEPL